MSALFANRATHVSSGGSSLGTVNRSIASNTRLKSWRSAAIAWARWLQIREEPAPAGSSLSSLKAAKQRAQQKIREQEKEQ